MAPTSVPRSQPSIASSTIPFFDDQMTVVTFRLRQRTFVVVDVSVPRTRRWFTILSFGSSA
mgnify:CR=1 FL=1